MRKMMLMWVLLLLVAAACAVTGDFKIVNDMFDTHAKFTRVEGPEYQLLVVSSENTNGMLLRIPRQAGLFYMKITPEGLLENAVFAASTNAYDEPNKVQITESPIPVFQRQWNRSLSEMFDSQSVGDQCRHFWKHHLNM